MHFLLWTKRSHQSSNVDTFKCSGKNLPNSSCHFSNHKLVFLQVFYYSLLPCKIAPLYFLMSNVIYFAQKEAINAEILRILSAQQKIHHTFVIFEKTNQFFLKFCITHSSISWDINPLYFFGWNFIHCQQNEHVKVQIWWNFMWAVKSLTFWTLIVCFCPNHINFRLKKYRRVICHETEEWCKA